MGRINTKDTAIAQWYELIKEAENRAEQAVEEDLEYYLVQMLQHFIDKPDIVSSIIALDYLIANDAVDTSRQQLLQDVGDKCLLFSGLFPEQAERRRVPVSYFVGLGEAAYYSVASFNQEHKAVAELYQSLGEHFVELMDVLLTVRQMNQDSNPINILQAEELWRKTGSKEALKIVKRYTDGFLVRNFPRC